MEGFPRPFTPNRPHWNYQRPHFNQWRSRPPPMMGNSNRLFRPRIFPNFNNGEPVRPQMNFNNEEYWCETCDKVFPAKNLLNKHLQQHQKCNIDGCQFVAHPKIITKHIQMQHSTGLYKKIAVLNNPEEINKWREERKKKYPTKANVEKKLAAVNEKIERGEKMGLGHERRRNHDNRPFIPADKRRQNNTTNENRPRSKHTKFNNSTESIKNILPNKKTREKKEHFKVLPELEKRKLKPFAGIQFLVEDITNDDIIEEKNNLNDLIEDEYVESEKVIFTDDKKPVVCTALSSLLCNYGSSDEDEVSNSIPLVSNNDEEKSNYTSSNSKQNIMEDNVSIERVKDKMNQIKQNDEGDEDSGPEEVKVEKTQETAMNNEKNETKETKKTKTNMKMKSEIHKFNSNKRMRPKLPSTLLQKLLSREMKQERNIILQCIRYIRKNNYFDQS